MGCGGCGGGGCDGGSGGRINAFRALPSEGLTCGRCVQGKYATTTSCESCDGANAGWLPITVVLIAVPLFLYYKTKKEERKDMTHWTSHASSVAAVLTLTLSYAQTLAICYSMTVTTPETVTNASPWVLWSLDISAMVNLGCLSDKAPFQAIFVVKLCGPIYLLALVCATFMGSQLIGKCRKSAALQLDPMIGAYGALYTAFFVAIICQVTNLFDCYPHPNAADEASLTLAPEVLCYSSEWEEVLYAFYSWSLQLTDYGSDPRI